MKIVYDVPSFTGGASQSLKQYIRVALENGDEAIAIVQSLKNAEVLSDIGVRLIEAPRWDFGNPLTWVRCYRWYSRILRSVGADMLHVNRKESFILAHCLRLGVGLPVLYMKAGHIPGLITTWILRRQRWVVYSQENKVDMIKMGVNEGRIDVWPQRFDFSKLREDPIKSFSRDPLDFALIGRLDVEKRESIETAIQLTECLLERGKNVRLHIYGEGVLASDVSRRMQTLNKKYGRPVVWMHGFKYPILDYLQSVSVVFGKGRSVLEPMAMGCIGVVVGESRVWSIVRPENFDELSYFNFSGRGRSVSDSIEQLSSLVDELESGEDHAVMRREIRQRVLALYDISALKPKLLARYRELSSEKRSGRPVLGWLSLMWALLVAIVFRVRKPDAVLW